MKRIGPFFLFLFLLGINDIFAQKFGYVDTQYILSRMSEYKAAQAEIETLAKGWEVEIQQKLKEVEEMEIALKAEEVLLTAELKAERKQEIDRKWREVKDFQRQIFGSDGLYFLKKKELIKPFQDRVFEAVERVAKNNRLEIVFDKSGELVMIYTNPVHDYTDYVIEDLGIGENKETENN
ncbi:MAG: OmpH family outer membrane protein [Cyclobacteriaceae bacterium]